MLHASVPVAQLNSATEYLAATGGSGDALQWVIIWGAILCGVLYFVRYRDGDHEISEDFGKALRRIGVKKGPRPEKAEEPPEPVEEAVSLSAAEVEALVERKLAERMSSMSVSAPIPTIPRQRAGEQVPPPPATVSFEKASRTSSAIFMASSRLAFSRMTTNSSPP